MQFIQTIEAPLPAGHYSQAVVAGGFVFVAGLLPIIPPTNERVPDGITAQTEQVLANLGAILRAAGSGLDHLVSVQIFISSPEYWKLVNEVYQRVLGTHKPARTIIPCGPLQRGALLEANGIAVIGGAQVVRKD